MLPLTTLRVCLVQRIFLLDESHPTRPDYRPDTADEDQDLWTANNMISDPHPGHTDSALIMWVIYFLSSPLL